MKSFVALVVLVCAASPAFAQDAPAPTGADTPAQQADAEAGRLTTYVPVEVLMADAGARAAVERHFPGIEENPLYEHLKSRSLRDIAPMAQGTIPDETLDALDRDLAALPPA